MDSSSSHIDLLVPSKRFQVYTYLRNNPGVFERFLETVENYESSNISPELEESILQANPCFISGTLHRAISQMIKDMKRGNDYKGYPEIALRPIFQRLGESGMFLVLETLRIANPQFQESDIMFSITDPMKLRNKRVFRVEQILMDLNYSFEALKLLFAQVLVEGFPRLRYGAIEGLSLIGFADALKTQMPRDGAFLLYVVLAYYIQHEALIPSLVSLSEPIATARYRYTQGKLCNASN